LKKADKILVIILLLTLFYTTKAIFASPSCSCGEDRVLKIDNPFLTGEDVLEVQVQLKKLGYYMENLNGTYDKETEKAVKNFQNDMGLVIDGIFGRKTLIQLAKTFEIPVSNALNEKPTGEVSIVIHSLDRKLTVMSDGKPYKSFPVAVGTFDTPTPIGLFTITEKSSWGEGFGARWMRLSVPWGIYGIHGTNKPWSIGGFESHGCIRMHNNHVQQVYDWVEVGTKVYIVGGIDGPFTFGLRPLARGSKGSDVVEVQKRLAGHGFYKGNFDGIFGSGTQEAVKAFQKANGLTPTGGVNFKTYEALGIQLFE
jgi:peptidoglycan hydrolase-like protein with peptidoglycan-binding domain